METPLRNFFVAGSDFGILNDNCIEADFLDAIGSEVHPRAIVCAVRVSSGVNKEARFRFVIPFSVTARNALLIALIKDDVAVSDHLVGRVIHSHLVSLQPICADPRVNVAFAY